MKRAKMFIEFNLISMNCDGATMQPMQLIFESLFPHFHDFQRKHFNILEFCGRKNTTKYHMQNSRNFSKFHLAVHQHGIGHIHIYFFSLAFEAFILDALPSIVF